jgi:hypothetical protein
VTPVANLPPVPPVSTTPAANFATGTAGIVDTGGKFATTVNDTGGKFAARCRRHRWPIATGINDTGGKLPPMSTTPVPNYGNIIRLLTP